MTITHNDPPSVSATGRPAAGSPPWWRVGMVWLVVGGPLAVVVASLVTAVVAYRGADQVLVDTGSTRVAPTTRPTAETPAMAARNHAATAAGSR